MKPKKIYIAGPMTGIENLNYPAFDEAAERIRTEGNIPISPAELNREHFGGRTDLPWHYYIGHDMANVALEADELLLLPGWHNSKGARIEFIIAAARRLEIHMPDPLTMHCDDIEGELSAIEDLNDIAEELSAIEDLNNIVEEARDKVFGDRNADYGHPDEDFQRAVEIIAHSIGVNLILKHIPLIMMAIKLSRQCHKPKRDNLVDIAGYVMTLYFDELQPK